jgi:twitching motility two-component system response regulator PilG
VEQGARPLSERKGTIERISSAAAALPCGIGHGSWTTVPRRVSAIAGYFAQCAGNAWRLLPQQRYEIIFLDVVLPDVGGDQICRTAEKNPATQDTPGNMQWWIFARSARVRGKMAGCSSYPVKHRIPRSVAEGRSRLPVDQERRERAICR